MLRKDKMKGQMAKRISAFMLATTLCVSACPVSVMAEKSPSVDNTTGVQSPSVDNETENEVVHNKTPKLKAIQILVNGKTQTGTGNKLELKKGDVITVYAQVEENGRLEEVRGVLDFQEEFCVDLTPNELGYLEGTFVCEGENFSEGSWVMTFYLVNDKYSDCIIYYAEGEYGFSQYYTEIVPSEDNSQDKNESEDNKETSGIKIKDIQVSKKDVVISDNTIQNKGNTGHRVDVTISLEGAFDKNTELRMTFGSSNPSDTIRTTFYYDASSQTFQECFLISASDIDAGYYETDTYKIKSITIDGKEVDYNGDKTLFTVKDNRTDKTAPVVNGIQVYVNDKLQTGVTFKAKKGDIIKAYVDVTDDNQVAGGHVTLSGTSKDEKFFYNVINLKPSEYDLEGQIEVKNDYEDMEYTITQIECWDLNENWANYYKDEEIASLYKEVKVENVGVSKNDTTDKALKGVVSKLDELIKLEGALDESTISKIEQAKKDGKEITAEISLSTIPEKSIDSKVKESVQQKAKESLGKDVKLAYLDISLNVMAGTSNLGTVNKLLEPIPVTVKLPEHLIGNYNYKIVRYHENADGTTDVTVLDATKNADGTLTFKTDRFSTYAIAYSEISEDENTENGNNNGTNNGNGNNNGTDNGNGNSNNETGNKKPSPITGQTGMIALYLTLAVSGMGALVFRKRVQK